MQNNALWIGVAVVVVVVAGILVFMGMDRDMMIPGTSQVGEENIEESTTSAQPTSLNALLASGISQKCSFSSTRNETSSGTVFIAMGQVRGDFSATSQGTTYHGHFIVKDDTTYVWADGMPQGFKSSFSASGGKANAQIDPDAPADYSCEPWSADESLFVVPTSISFVDVSYSIPAPSVSGSVE